MNFIEAVRTCFVRYFDFSGRSTRPEFWYYVLFLIIAGLIFDFIDASIAGEPFLDYEDLGFFGIIFFLLTIIPSISVQIRRLHDINRTGWWCLLAITIIGALPLLYWACLKGDNDNNRFGNNPLVEN